MALTGDSLPLACQRLLSELDNRRAEVKTALRELARTERSPVLQMAS